MGTSPASSEIQKRIHAIISKFQNAIHIKDDILIPGAGKEHDDGYLENLLDTLRDNNITVRQSKCQLGKTEVKWFSKIYSKEGMSPDSEKCAIIKNWPAPSSCKQVKSFLQTVQFNAKFLNAEKLVKKHILGLLKNARFIRGPINNLPFKKLKTDFIVIGSLQHMILSNKQDCTVILALWGHKH